jgi:hypothetical protein
MITNRDGIVIFIGVLIMAAGALIGGWKAESLEPLYFFNEAPNWWSQAKNILIVVGGSLAAIVYWILYKIFLENWVREENSTTTK